MNTCSAPTCQPQQHFVCAQHQLDFQEGVTIPELRDEIARLERRLDSLHAHREKEYNELAQEHVGLRRRAREFFFRMGIPSNPGWSPADFIAAFDQLEKKPHSLGGK